MKTFAPDYYKSFKCIADRCRRSCCIGWEIYLDDETLEKYEKLGGRYTESLSETEEGVCFKLSEGERCPFLNGRGLCDIITEKGEGFISEICREHPRFYSFFSDRTEVGLGLSCEEAARLIVMGMGKTELAVIDEDGIPEDELTAEEAYILEKRGEIFDILQNEKKSLSDRIAEVMTAVGVAFPRKSPAEWHDLFSHLEVMNKEWTALLKVIEKDIAEVKGFDNAFEKLMLYFIYRHTPSATDVADFGARVLFAIASCYIIGGIFAASEDHSIEYLCEIASLYSAEIEYSEENTATLVDILRDTQKSF